ncbi:hypothetical protein HDU96_005329 [Phlyctochytrium bullatum]|nr:hypothetical protein HDU96_005329 [Phlyctochytrium bullatum]
MTPFSMRCNSCGEYVYKGKKFNARKERVNGETYLGIQIFRFYIRCPKCSAEITFKTDPKNADYVAELGAQRNFEPWREERDADEELKAEREKEEENNPMKALENRTMDSKREMDILDALDEIRTKNAMNERIGVRALLDRILESKQEEETAKLKQQEDEDNAIARAMFQNSDGDRVRRIIDEDEHLKEVKTRYDDNLAGIVKIAPTSMAPAKRKAEDLGIVPKRNVKAQKAEASNAENPSKSSTSHPAPALALCNYSDSDD